MRLRDGRVPRGMAGIKRTGPPLPRLGLPQQAIEMHDLRASQVGVAQFRLPTLRMLLSLNQERSDAGYGV